MKAQNFQKEAKERRATESKSKRNKPEHQNGRTEIRTKSTKPENNSCTSEQVATSIPMNSVNQTTLELRTGIKWRNLLDQVEGVEM